jgi:mono/diheme cytochrome c family protein
MRQLAGLLLALLAGCGEAPIPAHLRIVDADAERGRAVIAQIGCGACHVIPGIAGARGRLGPPLERMSERTYIAGTFPNRPDTLIRFVRDAPSLAPETAMPELPLSEQEARDIAAFLYRAR